MAVSFITDKPRSLLEQFAMRIRQQEAQGKITTWVASDDGTYYTHKSADWNSKAWFKPSVESGKLTFYIVKPSNKNVTTVAYGYYHGHLIETFLNHFDNVFSKVEASPLPVSGDRCGS